MSLCDRLLLAKIGSLLSCLLCVDSTLVHPLENCCLKDYKKVWLLGRKYKEIRAGLRHEQYFSKSVFLLINQRQKRYSFSKKDHCMQNF